LAESFSGETKLDHRLRALLARTPPLERRNQTIRVLVKLGEYPEYFRKRAIQVVSVPGIATLTLALSEVQELSRDPAVLVIELSRPLGPDRKVQFVADDSQSGSNPHQK
jgi:hypothetical protein